MRFVNFIKVKKIFRRVRYQVIRWWRLHAVVPKLLRFNAYTGFVGRRLFHYIPFILPHDKSYYGFAHLVKPGDGLFLDVGANDGISAIGFHHIHSDYRIISFEPNRCHENSLKKLTKKLRRFEYHIMGAGFKTEIKTLHVPFYRGIPIYTAASVDLNYAKRSMLKQFGSAEIKVEYRQERINIIKLDDLNLKPDLIKIDAEGYGFEILRGLEKTIDRYVPTILIEFNVNLYEQELNFLSHKGYQLFTYDFKNDYFEIFHISKDKNYYKDSEGLNIFCIHEKMLGNIQSSIRHNP